VARAITARDVTTCSARAIGARDVRAWAAGAIVTRAIARRVVPGRVIDAVA
jgi:hypothetical protein